jgi:hypothetical protein
MSESSLPYGGISAPAALSTVWIPLEGRCEQWAEIGREACETGLLQITGFAFQALASEHQAYVSFEKAQCSPAPAAQMNGLDQAAEALLQARQSWSDAILALEFQIGKVQLATQHRKQASSLLAQVWHERVRITALLLEVEQAQLVYQRDSSTTGMRERARKDR